MRVAIFPALLIVFFSGCGPLEQGPPGSWGAEKTNTLVYPHVVPDTYEVDVCDPVAAWAVANIAIETINLDLAKAVPNTLTLEGYNVTYTALTEGAPPIEGGASDLVRTLPVEPVENERVFFIESDTKAAYCNAIDSGQYVPSEDFPSYTAKYTFYGRDTYDSGFGAVAGVDFKIGNCPLSVLPATASVAGLPNPDYDDPSDNVTFHISGGVGPYSVFSSSSSVVASPGSLGQGVRDFEVDPSDVTSPVDVTLTVSDSKGAEASTVLTVTP